MSNGSPSRRSRCVSVWLRQTASLSSAASVYFRIIAVSVEPGE